jgi:hypothetical protein
MPLNFDGNILASIAALGMAEVNFLPRSILGIFGLSTVISPRKFVIVQSDGSGGKATPHGGSAAFIRVFQGEFFRFYLIISNRQAQRRIDRIAILVDEI